MHFQACQVKNIFFRFWIFFLLDPGFLTALTHSEARWSHECVFVCCVVWGSGLLVGAKGSFAPLPSLSSASPSQACGSHYLDWLEGCAALPLPRDADPSTAIHNSQIQKESHVVAGTIIACCCHPCMDFLHHFPQYTLISVPNWITFLLKLKKKKVICLPLHHSILIHTKAYTLIPFCASAFWWHQEPKRFISMRTQTGIASPSTSLILFSWDFCSCIAAPGCWDILTIDYSAEYAGDYSLLFMEQAGRHSCI